MSTKTRLSTLILAPDRYIRHTRATAMVDRSRRPLKLYAGLRLQPESLVACHGTDEDELQKAWGDFAEIAPSNGPAKSDD